MTKLFNISNYNIDTSQFSSLLHDNIVEEFEKNFCEYVGAKYGCSVNSATSAIFLCLIGKNMIVTIPSMIPPVVANAILTSGNKLLFNDNVNWVGNSYVLHKFEDYKIIDSAQKVERNQFIKEANDNDLMIFSFYPTKPIGSCDGGMIVSNDFDKIKYFKEATMNGMSFSLNNWNRKIKFPGYKMYMNSVQCYIANENLKKLDQKKELLKKIRDIYNDEFGLSNASEHLYRINVENREKFINYMKENDVVCGIHYEALHLHPVYKTNQVLVNSEKEGKTTVSIPFHEMLTEDEINKILNLIKSFKNGND